MATRVLVCEDAHFVSEVLQFHLQNLGYEVAGVAYDGEEALRMAHELKPDLIILDLVMPRLNGIDVAKALQENQFVGSIVGVSSLDPSSLRPKMIAAGIQHFLAKPFTKETLREVLNKATSPKSIPYPKSG